MIDKDIKLKMKLLDTKIIEGIHINRFNNLPAHHYEVEELSQEKTLYRRRQKNLVTASPQSPSEGNKDHPQPSD